MSNKVLPEYPPLIGLFDTHSHPNDGRFDADRQDVFARMRETQMISVCVGADMASSREAVELAKKFSTDKSVGFVNCILAQVYKK